MAKLSPAQVTALRALDEEGSYGQYRAGAPRWSPNWYHPEHRPGNTYVDNRTARVLVEKGLAEIKHGRLRRTEKGTRVARGREES